jgi:ribonuclease VapC
MVVDASAFLAVLFDEDDADYHHKRMKSASQLWISPVNLWEIQVRLHQAIGPTGEAMFATIVSELPLEVVAITAEQASIAFQAFQRFGGRPARLNLGDCFAYALAKSKDAPLLFKGNDFLATDVKRV